MKPGRVEIETGHYISTSRNTILGIEIDLSVGEIDLNV